MPSEAYLQYTQSVLDAVFSGCGDALSAQAESRYEARLVNEAERMVAGDLEGEPTVEHLRVLLAQRGQIIGDEDVPF